MSWWGSHEVKYFFFVFFVSCFVFVFFRCVSELFCLVFSRFWPNCKKPWKNKTKKQKVQTHVPCQASPQTLAMGLNLFFFVFLFFNCCFACFSCEDAFITIPLKKNACLYNLHTCAPQAKLQKKTMEKPKFI